MGNVAYQDYFRTRINKSVKETDFLPMFVDVSFAGVPGVDPVKMASNSFILDKEFSWDGKLERLGFDEVCYDRCLR